MMNASILTTAAALSDRDLLSRLQQLAGNERAALVELLGHLAELDTRRSVYAAEGFGSLFAYCTRALHLSEDAAGTRIEVARACWALCTGLAGLTGTEEVGGLSPGP